MSIKGLPETITHQALLDAILALGIDPDAVHEVTISGRGHPDELFVSVAAFDITVDGARRIAAVGSGYAKHHVTYRVADMGHRAGGEYLAAKIEEAAK